MRRRLHLEVGVWWRRVGDEGSTFLVEHLPLHFGPLLGGGASHMTRVILGPLTELFIPPCIFVSSSASMRRRASAFKCCPPPLPLTNPPPLPLTIPPLPPPPPLPLTTPPPTPPCSLIFSFFRRLLRTRNRSTTDTHSIAKCGHLREHRTFCWAPHRDQAGRVSCS